MKFFHNCRKKSYDNFTTSKVVKTDKKFIQVIFLPPLNFRFIGICAYKTQNFAVLAGDTFSLFFTIKFLLQKIVENLK